MINVFASTIIKIPAQQVWDKVKDFNGLPNWHPAATDSHIEENGSGGVTGIVRNFALTDGSGRIRETLLAISDVEKSLTYDMLAGGPLPFIDYVSTMRFWPITDRDETFATWTAQFNVGDEREDHWQNFVENDVFLGGFKALEESFQTAP